MEIHSVVAIEILRSVAEETPEFLRKTEQAQWHNHGWILMSEALKPLIVDPRKAAKTLKMLPVNQVEWYHLWTQHALLHKLSLRVTLPKILKLKDEADLQTLRLALDHRITPQHKNHLNQKMPLKEVLIRRHFKVQDQWVRQAIIHVLPQAAVLVDVAGADSRI